VCLCSFLGITELARVSTCLVLRSCGSSRTGGADVCRLSHLITWGHTNVHDSHGVQGRSRSGPRSGSACIPTCTWQACCLSSSPACVSLSRRMGGGRACGDACKCRRHSDSFNRLSVNMYVKKSARVLTANKSVGSRSPSFTNRQNHSQNFAKVAFS
jgi:hypothetical protein